MVTTLFRHQSTPCRIHGGYSVLYKLSEEVDRLKGARAMVVCGQTVAHKTHIPTVVQEILGDKLVGLFDGVKSGSPSTTVLDGVSMANELNPDVIIAIGGGSAVVTARAITILLAEGGNLKDHCTKYPEGQPPVSPRLMKPKLPNIVIVTTPTTATNRSGTAVIDSETGHRLELFDPKTRPGVVFWDSEALLTAPPELCISSSGSLLSGVFAGLQAVNLNVLAEGDLRQSLNILMDNMHRIKSSPENGQTRINLCAASYMYNRAADSGFTGSATGVVTALAHSLDARYPGCDHGSAYSILTAPGMRFNVDYNCIGQSRLGHILGLSESPNEDKTTSEAAACRVSDIYNNLGMPTRLRDVGVPRDGIRTIAEDAMTDFALHRNIRPVQDVSDLETLMDELW